MSFHHASVLALIVLLLTAPGVHAQCDPANLFGTRQDYASFDGPSSVAIADLNADGLPDLVVTNEGYFAPNDRVSVRLGNGDGTFQPGASIATGNRPAFVAVADLNGDGKPDLAVVNEGSGTVSVLRGNGDGTFQPRVNFTVGNSPRSLAIADLNGDGVPDLAIANADSDTVSVLRGNGDGTFQPRVDFATGPSPSSIAIADLNGDGKPDITVANSDSNTVSVLRGNGNGTFQPRVDFAAGNSPRSLATADLNGDGVPDLTVANEGSDTVTVLRGNGDGTFQPRLISVTGSGLYFVAIADLNADGVPDLATTNFPGTVGVLLGNGDGTFQPQVDFATGAIPFSVAIADLNRDGAPDLTVPSYVNFVVSVHLNQCVPPSIDTQPVSRLAGPEPEQVLFSISAQGSGPLTYQWTRDGQPIENGPTISGAQSPTLTIMADTSSIAEYRCVVTAPSGSVTSMPAILGFRPNPCPADLNTDGLLNFFDISTYLDLFTAGCP